LRKGRRGGTARSSHGAQRLAPQRVAAVLKIWWLWRAYSSGATNLSLTACRGLVQAS
jgi:hypothetical protein